MKKRKGRARWVSGFTRFDEAGLRIVALFEAAKGAIVILAGLGLLSLIHQDVQKEAENIVLHLHLNPAKHFPRIIIDAAAATTNTHLWILALTAMLYSTIRFFEAYGLWRKQLWAEWFAVLSGGLYLPVEVYELTISISAVKICILLVNLTVVGLLAHLLWLSRSKRKQ